MVREECPHFFRGERCTGAGLPHPESIRGCTVPTGCRRLSEQPVTHKPSLRDAGWNCPRCDAVNMRGRAKCFKCSTPRPEGEAPPPGEEVPVTKRRKKGKRKMPPRHGWKRYLKVRGSSAAAAFRARAATKYYPESGSDVNHPFAQLVMQEGLVTVFGGLTVCLLSTIWRQAEVVVESVAKGVVFVIDTIAMVGADTVEMVGFVTKILLMVYGVVMCLQLLATHWHLLVKLMLLLAGRNPEANVAREGPSPFPAEVQEVWSSGGCSNGGCRLATLPSARGKGKELWYSGSWLLYQVDVGSELGFGCQGNVH